MLAWQATWPSTLGGAVALARTGAQLVQLDRQLEGVAGDDLAAEASFVDAAEERQLAGVSLVGEEGDAPQLGQGLDHQHSGQGGPTGEMPAEEGFSPGQVPHPPGRGCTARSR